jgi:hypothetical protein
VLRGLARPIPSGVLVGLPSLPHAAGVRRVRPINMPTAYDNSLTQRLWPFNPWPPLPSSTGYRGQFCDHPCLSATPYGYPQCPVVLGHRRGGGHQVRQLLVSLVIAIMVQCAQSHGFFRKGLRPNARATPNPRRLALYKGNLFFGGLTPCAQQGTVPGFFLTVWARPQRSPKPPPTPCHRGKQVPESPIFVAHFPCLWAWVMFQPDHNTRYPGRGGVRAASSCHRVSQPSRVPGVQTMEPQASALCASAVSYRHPRRRLRFAKPSLQVDNSESGFKLVLTCGCFPGASRHQLSGVHPVTGPRVPCRDGWLVGGMLGRICMESAASVWNSRPACGMPVSPHRSRQPPRITRKVPCQLNRCHWHLFPPRYRAPLPPPRQTLGHSPSVRHPSNRDLASARSGPFPTSALMCHETGTSDVSFGSLVSVFGP